MVKSGAELLKKSKERRKNYLQSNKDLKLKKNWYDTSDVKQHFVEEEELSILKDWTVDYY